MEDVIVQVIALSTYTIMETVSGKVVDTVVIPVTDVKNSNAMEKRGFTKVLKKIEE